MNDPLLSTAVRQLWNPTRYKNGVGYSSPFGHTNLPIQFFPKFKLKVVDWNQLSRRTGQDLVGALHFDRNYRRGATLDKSWLTVSLRPQDITHPCAPTLDTYAPKPQYQPHEQQLLVSLPPVAETAVTAKITIDREWVREQLATLPGPYYFWDIETAAPVVPRWQGFQTMQNVPFLSICQDTDKRLRSNVTSTLFLDCLGDVEQFWAGIRSQLGEEGTIFTYSDFEWHRMHDVLAILAFRGKDVEEDRRWLHKAHARSVDLYQWMQRVYHHSDPTARLSLKAIAPRHFPQHYANCTVTNGMDATDLYLQHWVYRPCQDKQSEVQSAIIDYCTADVTLMIELLKFLM